MERRASPPVHPIGGWPSSPPRYNRILFQPLNQNTPGVPHFSHLRSGPRHNRQHSLVPLVAPVILSNSRIKLDNLSYNESKKNKSSQARRPTTYNSARQP